MADADVAFGGSIPEYYDSCLGPAWFDAFAIDLARRLPAQGTGDVLEIACGTGLVTRRLRARMNPGRLLVASDLSQPMLNYARNKLSHLDGIDWREADAGKLPFADAQFAVVVCAFGVMFVPDKQAAFREVRRVLRPGGTFLFNVWDRLEDNPAPRINARVLEEIFPGDAEIRFRTPYQMHDPDLLRELLHECGFTEQRIEKKTIQVDRVSARTIATGQVRGTPRATLIEKRGVALAAVVDKVAAALAETGGSDPWTGTASAVVVEARADGVPRVPR